MNLIEQVLFSWKCCDGINSLEEILSWVDEKNKNLKVLIYKNALSDSNFWFYDEKNGEIINKNKQGEIK